MVPELTFKQLFSCSEKDFKQLLDQINKDLMVSGFQLSASTNNMSSLMEEHGKIIDEMLRKNGNISGYLYRLDLPEKSLVEAFHSDQPIQEISKKCILRAYSKIKLREKFSPPPK